MGTCVPPPGGDAALQQPVAIVLPEYTAVNMFEPWPSCEALSGTLAAEAVAPIGKSGWLASTVEASMMFTLPLGTPAPAGTAATVTASVVEPPGERWYEPAVSVAAIALAAMPVTS